MALAHDRDARARSSGDNVRNGSFTEERCYFQGVETAGDAEEQLEALLDLLAAISHDLRNPLGTITVAASALCKSGEQRTRDHAARIQRQATRMTRLIDDLVDFARLQAGRVSLSRAPHPVTSLLEATHELFGPVAKERGIDLVAEAPGSLPALDCDAQRAVQALGSLVAAAFKVTGPGGTVTIGARRRERVELFVRDGGPGGGTVHGLAIARCLVDAHGGLLWTESTPDVGTTVYVCL